jgi:hypothetical protein
LSDTEKLLKLSVSSKIEGAFTKTLGFEPTIRNIFRIFTVHAEIFMESLQEASKNANTDLSGLRMVEMIKLKDDLDIHKFDTDTGGVLKTPQIYPWPLYREKSSSQSKNNVYEEAWLGAAVDAPENVQEIVFVEQVV